MLATAQTVLDIGCGWGSLALYLAKIEHVSVIGITLSKEQLKLATCRAKNAGLSKRVQFLLKDYREITGKFDRIVSVGMFEHVGVAKYNNYFKQINTLLASEGLVLLDPLENHIMPAYLLRGLKNIFFQGDIYLFYQKFCQLSRKSIFM